MKLFGNRYPCCNLATGFKSENYKDGDEVEKICRRCGTKYKVKFTKSVAMGNEVLRLGFEKLTNAGGRAL